MGRPEDPDPNPDQDQAAGIHALNQDFADYEQVHKPQRYHLSEHGEEDRYDEHFEIRHCDMRRPPAEFADELHQALREIGFAVLTGHGIPASRFRHGHQLTRTFFETIDEDRRQAYLARRHGSVNQGYFPERQTTRIHPDLVQGWVFCRRAFKLPTAAGGQPCPRAVDALWPDPAFEAGLRPLVQALEGLILPVMQAILRGLGGDPHAYDERLTRTNFGLRLNYYPPLSDAQLATGGGRMLGHEDVDLFTLLPAPSEEGLQVLNRRKGRWIRLQPPAGSIILNVGDYLQRLSNDILPSTTHRVVPPRNPAARRRPRTSTPLAVYLWEHETLEVLPGLGEPRYPPVNVERFHTAITSKYYGDDYAAEFEQE